MIASLRYPQSCPRAIGRQTWGCTLSQSLVRNDTHLRGLICRTQILWIDQAPRAPNRRDILLNPMPPLAQPLLNEITAKVAAIEGADAASAGPHWGAMHKLLLKAKVDPAAIMRLVGGRDVKELKRVAARLRGEEVAEDVVAPAPAAVAVDASVMQSALKIFRRRVKFAQLDAESKLGVGPMSGGAQHKIDAMIPPREFPMHVWEALVHAGKLRREGEGFYSLVDDNSQVHW